MADKLKPYAQVAYEAYVKSCGGKSVHGEDLPSWEDQNPAIRDHWGAAARAVVGAVVAEETSQ